jgi:hypothetical protein
MAHIASIGASLFSDLSVCTDPTTTTAAQASATETTLEACFAATKFTRITNVREFPSMGTPANIVNVPVYGQKTSSQVQGQADAPSIEITINYVPSLWSTGSVLGAMIGDGDQKVFRFTLLNEQPAGFDSGIPTSVPSTSIGGSTTGPVQNSSYYFIGKIEALLVNPQLTDATTATLTLSTQSDFYGAFTIGT